MSALAVIHWLCGLVVVAEALNKLERTHVFQPGLSARQRTAMVLKAVAWAGLALGAGGVVVTPILSLPAPSVREVCVIFGFAVLIIRTRVKEG